LQAACSNALNLFRLLAILLKPVLPALSAKAEAFLNVAPFVWDDGGTVLAAGHAINAYRHLLTRVDKKQVDALVEANRESLVRHPASGAAETRRAPGEGGCRCRRAGGCRQRSPGRTSASTIS
jgi:methionyl-tRNA synthetase